MNEQPRVIVFAGPSGGHLFPAKAFGEIFKKRFPNGRVTLVTGKKGERFCDSFQQHIFSELYFISDFPFPSRIFWGLFGFLLKLLQAFFSAARLLAKEKPDLYVGFGSYISYPGALLSAWRRVPVLIHEQNRSLGKATRWAIPHADCLAVAFEEALKEVDVDVPKKFVGLPVRSALKEAVAVGDCRGQDGIFKILIVGGSQGSYRMNQIILDGFSRLVSEEKSKIAVIHITGDKDYSWVTRRYREFRMRYETYPFFEDMVVLYQRANMAITRAGANTLFELALFKIPAIVVPYPFANQHQAMNCKAFEVNHAIIAREENKLEPDWLLEEVKMLRTDLEYRDRLSEQIGKMAKPHAAEDLVDLAEKLFKFNGNSRL